MTLVIVPAHNEEHALRRNLPGLLADVGSRAEVVVAANGCSDATVAVARTLGATVLEVEEASKTLAINAADLARDPGPRIVLDADTRLDSSAVDGLLDAVAGEGVRHVAPRRVVNTAGTSTWVKHYYSVASEVAQRRGSLIGRGVYGLTASARDRVFPLPPVLNDDYVVERCFGPSERLEVPGAAHVEAPLSRRHLIRVRARIARGNRELMVSEQSRAKMPSTGRTLTSLARAPRRWPSIAIFVMTSVLARWRSRRGEDGWARDESRRAPAHD